MMPKGKRRRATVCFVAAVIVTCYLAQTIDCYRPKKTERHEGRRGAGAAKTIGVQEGRILFGRVLEKGSGVESQIINGTKKSSSNSPVDDEAAYQADFTGWPKGQMQATSSWTRMAPSLQCGGEQLKFRAVGPGASQFAVDQGNAPPMPLSQVPSTCGYSMHMNSLVLVMLVPYNGCNMVQEGGGYVLPMRWHGIPVSLWCPAPVPTTVSPSDPVPQTPWYPQVPQTPPPSRGPSVPKVTMATTTEKPEVPQVPQYPFYPTYFHPFPWPYQEPLPATSEPTTTSKPQVPQFPPYYPYPKYPFPLPATSEPITTGKPQVPQFPPYYPYPKYPFPLPATSEPTTTGKPQVPQFPPYYPYPKYPFPLPATSEPITTSKPQVPQFPPYYHYPKYPFPLPAPTTTTAAPTTVTAPAAEKTLPPQFHPNVHPPFLYPHYPV